MFVYYFLENNLAWAFLFDNVRLLNFEGSRFFFQYFLKNNQNCCPMLFGPKQVCNTLHFISKCLITNSYCNFLQRIFGPVPLFHYVRLLIFEESPPLCDYFMLFVYLIVKITLLLTHKKMVQNCRSVVTYQLKCGLSIKRSKGAVSHKQIEQKTFFQWY